METKRTRELLDKLELEFNILIQVEVQPTHCFDVNAPDALGHSSIKRYMRSRSAPRHAAHLVWDFNLAVKNGLTDRAIQRSFMRAYSKDAQGDTDETLIPKKLSIGMMIPTTQMRKSPQTWKLTTPWGF